jgi:hypothetical protein
MFRIWARPWARPTARWLVCVIRGASDLPDAHHRTLSTYVNGLARFGLDIERLLEPRATGDYADLAPVHRRVPVALVVRCARRRVPADSGG